MAKNVGIRRACGEYVLVSNPDVIMQTAFWRFVSERGMAPTRMYRTPRLDSLAVLPAQALTGWSMDRVMSHLRVRV